MITNQVHWLSGALCEFCRSDYVAIRLNTGFVFIEANIGVQSRHTDINARLARDVVRIGFPEFAFVKNIFREFNYVDMIVIAVPHGGVQIAWLWSLRYHSPLAKCNAHIGFAIEFSSIGTLARLVVCKRAMSL